MNALERFQEYWKTLDDEERRYMWDLLAFTRGPDELAGEGIPYNTSDLKKFTTARVRAFIVGDDMVDKLRKFIMAREVPLTSEEIDQRETILWYVHLHFKDHYHDAAEAIRYFTGYDLIDEIEVKE